MEARHEADSGAGTDGYVLLGTFASRAPRPALLHALQQLRPQCTVRLAACGETRDGTLYRVELRNEPHVAPATIDAWLRIKSALIAAFPPDAPHAVRACDP